MKYVAGSLIISFGIMFIAVVILNAMNIKAPENVIQYLGIAWMIVAILTYPLAKKLVR